MALLEMFAARTFSAFDELGLCLAGNAQIEIGREMAARHIGRTIACAEILTAVQARTGCAIFTVPGADGGVSGALSIIPLTAAAWPALRVGEFDGLTPPLEMVARPCDPVVALYGWGMAGDTWRARGVILAAALRLQREIYAEVPIYGRAATAGGERVLMKRLGAQPAPGRGGLVLAPAFTARREAA